MVSRKWNAAEAMRPIYAPGDKTLPMTADAEGWLHLTISWSSNRLSAADTMFHQKAMREYGRLCVAEAARASAA